MGKAILLFRFFIFYFSLSLPKAESWCFRASVQCVQHPPVSLSQGRGLGLRAYTAGARSDTVVTSYVYSCVAIDRANDTVLPFLIDYFFFFFFFNVQVVLSASG